MAVVALAATGLTGSVEPLVPGSYLLLEVSPVRARDANDLVEVFVTGVCGDPKFVPAAGIGDDHFVHNLNLVLSAHQLGPRKGIPLSAKRLKLQIHWQKYDYAKEDEAALIGAAKATAEGEGYTTGGVVPVAAVATGAGVPTHDAAGRGLGWIVSQPSGKFQLGAQVEPSAFAGSENQMMEMSGV